MELGLALGKRLRRPMSGMDRGFHSYPAARDVIVERCEGVVWRAAGLPAS